MMDSHADSTIVLVTKFPVKGVSKTRLYPTLGEEKAFTLARAMFADLLNSFATCAGKKVIYTPKHSISEAAEFCRFVCPRWSEWSVEPMGGVATDLSSSDLTSLLSYALRLQHYSLTLLSHDRKVDTYITLHCFKATYSRCISIIQLHSVHIIPSQICLSEHIHNSHP
jgi:hypothetical protein